MASACSQCGVRAAGKGSSQLLQEKSKASCDVAVLAVPRQFSPDRQAFSGESWLPRIPQTVQTHLKLWATPGRGVSSPNTLRNGQGFFV